MKKIIILLGILSLFIVACKPTADPSPTFEDFVADRIINIEAFSFGFNPNQITVEKGEKITLIVENIESKIHTFTLSEFGIDKRLNNLQTVTIDFIADKSGTFEFFCTIPFHRPAGMEGELNVN